MNKTTSISINDKKFDLEVEANEMLDRYFASVQNYFSTHANKAEILTDIESSIEEKLTEKLGKHKNVITKKDVEDVIKSMGTVEDFQQFDEYNAPANGKEALPESKIVKKLYRDKDNKIFGGVALGLAMYFNLDVSFVRAFFVLTTLFWGFGIILYIVLWIVVPEAKTTAQKIEMYGGESALSSIEKKISTQSIMEKNETKERIRKAIGIFLIVLSLGAFVMVTNFLLTLSSITSMGSVEGTATFFILFIVLCVFILPFVILFYIGKSLVKNKKISKFMIGFLVFMSIMMVLLLRILM